MGRKKKRYPQPADPLRAEPSRGSLDTLVLDRISDPFFALDVDGRFTCLNAAMERTVGLLRTELLGHEIWSRWPEAAGTPLHEALNIAAGAGPSTFFAQFPPRSTFYEVRVYPSPAGISVLLRDAGSQAGSGGHFEAERDLALGQTGTWRLNVHGELLLWSDENYRFFGIPKGTPLGYEAFLATIRSEVLGRSWRAERDLAQSHARFDSVVETAMDAIIAIDANQRIVLFNSAAEAMFHWTSTMILGQPIDKLIPERFRNVHASHIAAFASSGVTGRAMGRLGILWGLTAGGREFPIEAAISQAEAGASKIFTVIIRDITERLKAEEQQRLLTAELDHRVKNMLANVNAILRMSAGGARSVQEFSESLSARLDALASAHNMLQGARWEGADLSFLCELVLGPFRSQTGNIQLKGLPLTIAPGAAQAIALALHELATNAVKYGALSVPDGRVTVSWWRSPKPAPPDRACIVWRESGGPPVAAPARKGFGLAVLQDMTAYALDAAVNCEFHPRGLTWTLDGPFALPPGPGGGEGPSVT
jgi:PAS domain S-box-containing protein